MNNQNNTYCYHCGDACNETIVFRDKPFCCNGCKTVYEILNDNGLTDYYSIENKPGVKKNESSNYDFLESDKVVENLLLFKDDKVAHAEILLPQIHCASCVWLLENLNMLNKGVKSSQVNFIKKKARISFNPNEISLKQLALLLDSIGYAPVFDVEEKQKAKSINSGFYIRLGIAGFCFGNIMLLSFPEYLGLTNEHFKEFGTLFRYLILALSIPILFIAFKEYVSPAIKGLKSKFVSIDVPISLGILVLFIKSFYDVVFLEEATYLDSFAGFVFFLLIGKWFQNKTYGVLSFERDYKSYFPLAIGKKEKEGEVIMTPIEELNENDEIVIKNNDIIPADSILKSETAHVNYAFVTGESDLKRVSKGELIYAGGRLAGNEVLVRVRKKVDRSYLTHLWNQTAFTKKTDSEYSNITNKLSKVFTLTLLVIALLAGVLWYFIDPSRITFVVVSVLIVACPCALALALPFTYGNALRFIGKNGLYLKNSFVIEKMSEITDAVFDKTGTLTYVDKANVTWKGQSLTEQELSFIYSLTGQSNHVLSQAIYQQINEAEKAEVINYKEEIGKGIEGEINGKKVKIGSAKFLNLPIENEGSLAYVQIEDKVLGKYTITNQYREGINEIAHQLKNLGIKLHLLSGDNESEKERILKLLGEDTQTRFNQKPIDKLDYIKNLQEEGKKVLMIGDGLNDSGGLKQSDMGIAIVDDIYHFSPSSDGILEASFFNKLDWFIKKSKTAITILRICFVFSFLYNLIGLYFAISGQLTPLVATILMPLSSISVVVISSVLTKIIFSKK